MKMNKLSALCLAGTMLTASSMAMAWESEDGNHAVDFGVALATDYIWRGYSQTDRAPAASGSIDYSHSSGLYVGTWASNVEYQDGADYEIDLYAGYGGEFAGIGFDIGALRYFFDSSGANSTKDWNEFYGSLSYSYFSVGVAHSGDVYGSGEDGTYYSLGFDTDLPWGGLALSAGVGYYDYDKGAVSATKDREHTDWRIGLSKTINSLDLGLTFTGMDDDAEDDFGKSTSDKLTLSVATSF